MEIDPDIVIPVARGNNSILQIRPFEPYETGTLIQKYFPNATDVFKTPNRIQQTEAFQNDLKKLLFLLEALKSQGKFMDLLGPNNIVVGREGHIRIIDVGLGNPSNLTARQIEAINQRFDLLENMRI